MSERIKTRMAELGLKQRHLMNSTGASKGAVSQWYNGKGKPSGEYLLSLAKVLKCDPDWLQHGKRLNRPKSADDMVGMIVMERGETYHTEKLATEQLIHTILKLEKEQILTTQAIKFLNQFLEQIAIKK